MVLPAAYGSGLLGLFRIIWFCVWSYPMRLLGKALTFDDVLLVPAFSQVLPRDTSLATQ